MRKRRMTALFLAALLAVGCGRAEKAQAPAEETAFTVNQEEISLREWNFYIRMNQMQWERDYLELYGDAMWDMEVDEDGTTLADNLSSEVLDVIVRIHLTNQHAEEYGVALDENAREEIRERAKKFMTTYHEALLRFAEADEDFVYEKLLEKELSILTAEASVADYEPELEEEDYHREGICYVLISTTGTRDGDGNLTPFSEEEVERRTSLAAEVSRLAKENADLKGTAEAKELTPIESSMGADNEGDGHEPRMLDAARALAVGEVSDPIWTEEGWFVVQHTSDYDRDGTEYWKQYLTDMAREERCTQIYEDWKASASITLNQEVMDKINVKHVLKELL